MANNVHVDGDDDERSCLSAATPAAGKSRRLGSILVMSTREIKRP